MKYCLTFWDAVGQDWLLGPAGAARAGSFSVFFSNLEGRVGGEAPLLDFLEMISEAFAIYQRK